MTLNGPARAAAAAGVAAIAFLGVGAGVLAFGDNGDGTSSPTTTTQEVQAVASIDSTAPTTAAPVTAAPETPTTPPLAPGFADYTPGDELAVPDAPVGDAPVSTVPGPYGPVYPDGYVDPNIPPATVDTTPPAPRPVGN